MLLEVGPLLQKSVKVDAMARKRSPEVDKIIQLMSYMMLENFTIVIFGHSLRSLRDEELKLGKFHFPSSRCSFLFGTRMETLNKALNIVRQRPPLVEQAELDRNGNVMMRTVSRSDLDSL